MRFYIESTSAGWASQPLSQEQLEKLGKRVTLKKRGAAVLAEISLGKIADLVALAKELDHPLIVMDGEKSSKDCPVIEIYDDYRE